MVKFSSRRLYVAALAFFCSLPSAFCQERREVTLCLNPLRIANELDTPEAFSRRLRQVIQVDLQQALASESARRLGPEAMSIATRALEAVQQRLTRFKVKSFRAAGSCELRILPGDESPLSRLAAKLERKFNALLVFDPCKLAAHAASGMYNATLRGGKLYIDVNSIAGNSLSLTAIHEYRHLIFDRVYGREARGNCLTSMSFSHPSQGFSCGKLSASQNYGGYFSLEELSTYTHDVILRLRRWLDGEQKPDVIKSLSREIERIESFINEATRQLQLIQPQLQPDSALGGLYTLNFAWLWGRPDRHTFQAPNQVSEVTIALAELGYCPLVPEERVRKLANEYVAEALAMLAEIQPQVSEARFRLRQLDGGGLPSKHEISSLLQLMSAVEVRLNAELKAAARKPCPH